jgi:Xaa-Pro aminopeptidase
MITQREYQTRRQVLARKLPDNAIAIISGAKEVMRNGDSHYPFRQASDFYYFTGFNEPDAILLIINDSDASSYLFNRPHNAVEEQWTGKRLGIHAVSQQLGIHQSFDIDTFKAQLPQLLANKSAVFYTLGHENFIGEQIISTIYYLKNKHRQGITSPETIGDLSNLIGEMRLFKSDDELAIMRKVAAISVSAHQRAMKACRYVAYEYQLEAELLYEFNRQGCRHVAYSPIVGSGANSCILHYTENNQLLQPGDLVLIDAGAELANYAADITRTFPINGRFSEAQKAIYQLVLNAQRAGIATIKPGALWSIVQETIVHVLTAGLVDLGILQGCVDDLIASGAYKPFYMHNSGHWLGLDVHDSGLYTVANQWRVFEPGMVLTVEPGLYFKANMPGVATCWWNIGVRIEDDILVTKTGYENLTADLAVEIADIEALMQESIID